MQIIRSLALVATLIPVSLVAQVEYHGLDAERPLATEDAYALERGAVELTLPLGLERFEGRSAQLVVPEIGVGLTNAQLTFSWPLLRQDGGRVRGLGPRAGFMFTPFTQPRRWPAIGLRVDAAAIEGDDGALDGRLTGKLIATRALGVTRVHLNLALTAGPETPDVEEEFPARRSLGVAVDRTFWRQSLLVGLEGGLVEARRDARSEVFAGVGFRWQWTPVDVLDLGWRRTGEGEGSASYRWTIGVTHAWSLGRASRRAAPVLPPSLERRDDQTYAGGPFNWRFLAAAPDAARLFNAFDYGHAVLYERLLTERRAALDASLATEYRFLTEDLLVRPPRFAIAEEAIMPEYASEFWRAKQVFEWAHLLHRQIYDVYAHCAIVDCGPGRADSLIEALTDRYLERRAYALASVPKAMSLMEGRPYSGIFAREQPRFNGLIWAYHWLQVGLYEPYARAHAAGGAPVHPPLGPVLDRFRQMVATDHTPEVMPMTSAVAPTFTTAHPRAAAIFDNLHALHDVISDVLLNDAVVPRSEKRAMLWRALAEYQDAVRDQESDEHWRMMGEMVGGVERMGGSVP